MKLKKDFILRNLDKGATLVPIGESAFSGIVPGNKTVGAMLELLKEGTTESELIAVLKDRFDAPEGAIEKDVQRIIAQLREIGALEEE